MKIKFSYLPEEEQEAAADLTALQLRHPGAKVRRGSKDPAQCQVYLRVPSGHGRRLAPCDFCRHSPPSSFDGKPCTMCPAALKP